MKEKIISIYHKFINLIKTSSKNNLLLWYFIISACLNALLLRWLTIGTFINIKAFILDLATLIIIGAFSFLIKEKNRTLYFMIASIITTLICIVNSIYYTFYESFASFSLLATSTQVVDVGDAILENVLKFKDLTFLWQPIFVYYIHNIHLKKSKEPVYKTKKECRSYFYKYNIIALILIMISVIFTTPTEWGRFGKLWNREYVVNKFGIYVYQINDIVQSLTPKLNTLFGYDKAYKKTVEYYKESNHESKTNEYTGLFEGKNIIAIHAESIQTLTMNLNFNGEEVTPNLNKIAKSGMFFSNFYAQVGVGNSSDSEFTLNTSLMPSNSGTVFINYYDREYITIPKLLKEKGYYTFSMHGNTGDFWNRNNMHKNMGYDMFYHKDYFEIDESIYFGLSDKSFFRQAVPIIKSIKEEKKTPFYATLIMLSNHTPWNDLELTDEFPTDYKVEIDGKIVTRPYLEGTTFGNYIRLVHYADQAIGELFDQLDAAGLLDDTVVIIYGDHDARLDKKYYNILYNYDPIKDTMKKEGDPGYVKIDDLRYNLDKKVPFIIWSKDTNFNLEIEKPMGMIDVLPTLGNMFNFKSPYQLGNDIFSTEDNMVVFPDGNYLTSKYYYDSQKELTYSLKGDPIDKNYIEKRRQESSNIVEISNYITTYDLIKNIRIKNEQNKK